MKVRFVVSSLPDMDIPGILLDDNYVVECDSAKDVLALIKLERNCERLLTAVTMKEVNGRVSRLSKLEEIQKEYFGN